MPVSGAKDHITQVVIQWEGVSAHPHLFGGTEYHLGKRELGHIHGDSLVDIPFPTRIRDQLVESGQAQAHHVLPESGWVSFYLKDWSDVTQAVDLLRQSYEIACNQRKRRD